jgi:hypothetical protein
MTSTGAARCFGAPRICAGRVLSTGDQGRRGWQELMVPAAWDYNWWRNPSFPAEKGGMPPPTLLTVRHPSGPATTEIDGARPGVVAARSPELASGAGYYFLHG